MLFWRNLWNQTLFLLNVPHILSTRNLLQNIGLDSHRKESLPRYRSQCTMPKHRRRSTTSIDFGTTDKEILNRHFPLRRIVVLTASKYPPLVWITQRRKPTKPNQRDERKEGKCEQIHVAGRLVSADGTHNLWWVTLVYDGEGNGRTQHAADVRATWFPDQKHQRAGENGVVYRSEQVHRRRELVFKLIATGRDFDSMKGGS